MSGILTVLLVNAAAATFLALLFALVSRWVRRPAVLHALWVIVLLKLLSPPIFEVGLVPQVWLSPLLASQMSETAPFRADRWDAMAGVSLLRGAGEGEEDPAGTGIPGHSDLISWGPTLWLAGAAGVLALVWIRGRRFKRLLTHARPAPRELQEITGKLATRMGLARAPAVLAVDARISPMVWPRPGSLKLLFPSELLGRLSRHEREALVAHELAHVARKDHWVRYLELVAACGFWWHPVVWWARSRLRAAEEQCCDALVLRTISTHPRTYAQGLLKTLEFLAGRPAPRPALASGAGGMRRLEERLTMIMRERSNLFVSRPYRLALALTGLGAILIFPTWADLAPGDPPEDPVEVRDSRHVLDLERQALLLKEELQEVKARQKEIEQKLRQLHRQERVDRLRGQAMELEAAGRVEEARAVHQELAALEMQFDLERKHEFMEQDLRREMGRTEAELRRMMLEMEEHRSRGDLDLRGALELERRAAELDRRLEETASRARERGEEVEGEARLDVELDRLRLESRRLREAGRVAEAERIEHRIELLAVERMLARAREPLVRREQIRELKEAASKLESEGRLEEALEVRRMLEERLEEWEEGGDREQ